MGLWARRLEKDGGGKKIRQRRKLNQVASTVTLSKKGKSAGSQVVVRYSQV